MPTPKRLRSLFLAAFLVSSFLLGCWRLTLLNTQRLSEKDIEQVKQVIAKLGPMIEQRNREGTLPTLTYEELYSPLNLKEQKFLKQFQCLEGKKLGVSIPYRGLAEGKEKLLRIDGQKIRMNGKPEVLPPQFLPAPVYEAYQTMMEAMQEDLGRRLYIESGYRSSAYQLYLFVFYLQNHDYSIRETVKWVALPGYSEHGSVQFQAVDFINEEGISGETDPAGFERLPEYEWLLTNAKKYGFVLSYPRGVSGITFEPWHWRYEKSA